MRAKLLTWIVTVWHHLKAVRIRRKRLRICRRAMDRGFITYRDIDTLAHAKYK